MAGRGLGGHSPDASPRLSDLDQAAPPDRRPSIVRLAAATRLVGRIGRGSRARPAAGGHRARRARDGSFPLAGTPAGGYRSVGSRAHRMGDRGRRERTERPADGTAMGSKRSRSVPHRLRSLLLQAMGRVRRTWRSRRKEKGRPPVGRPPVGGDARMCVHGSLGCCHMTGLLAIKPLRETVHGEVRWLSSPSLESRRSGPYCHRPLRAAQDNPSLSLRPAALLGRRLI